jgi:hypothetical protein
MVVTEARAALRYHLRENVCEALLAQGRELYQLLTPVKS